MRDHFRYVVCCFHSILLKGCYFTASRGDLINIAREEARSKTRVSFVFLFCWNLLEVSQSSLYERIYRNLYARNYRLSLPPSLFLFHTVFFQRFTYGNLKENFQNWRSAVLPIFDGLLNQFKYMNLKERICYLLHFQVCSGFSWFGVTAMYLRRYKGKGIRKASGPEAC